MKRIAGIFLFALTLCAPAAMATVQQNKAEQMYQQALYEMEGKGEYAKAIGLFNAVAARFPNEKSIAAKALLRVGMCQEKLGRSEATKAYERVIRDFADQRDAVKEARARLSSLKQQISSPIPVSVAARKVWSGNGVLLNGNVSPDGRFAAGTDRATGYVAILDLHTGEKRTLPNPKSGDSSQWVGGSIWSPTGKRLACLVQHFQPSGNYRLEVQVVEVEGVNRRVLLNSFDTWWITPFEWSPDGKYILALFVMKDSAQSKRICLVSTENGAVRVLKTENMWNGNLSGRMYFSPDGNFILYSSPVREKGKECDIFVLSIDGRRQTRLVPGPANERAIGWSPDGGKVIYLSDRGGNEDVFSVRVIDGKAQGSPERIRANVGKILPLGITQTGSVIYSQRNYVTSDIFFATIDPESGRLIGSQRLATRGYYGLNGPEGWSPDGKQLLYRSYLQGDPKEVEPKVALITLFLENNREKEIKLPLKPEVQRPFFAISARWLTDGKHVLVRGATQVGKEDLHIVDVESGEAKTLGQEIPPIQLSLSSNRSTIYFFRADSLIAHDIDDGKERLLCSTPPIDSYTIPSASWDGHSVAFPLRTANDSTSIIVVPALGGTPREVCRVKNASSLFTLCWSRDGRFIYFVQPGAEPSTEELWRVSLEGGKAQPSGLIGSSLWGLEFHPDGKTLVFAATDRPPTEIWMLDNLLQNQKSDLGDQAEIVAQAQMRLAALGGSVGKGVVALQVGAKLGDRVYGRAISREGRSLAYTNHGVVFIHDLLTDKERLVVARATPEESYSDAIISPDGKLITYAKHTSGKIVELYVVGSDGSNPRLLAGGKDPRVWPWGWSPDGRYIFAESMGVEGKHDAILVSILDGSSRDVASNMDWGKFSPDGRYIAYVKVPKQESEDTEGREILVGSSSGGKPVRLVNGRVPVWSPDGGKLLFARQRTGGAELWCISVANGAAGGDPELVRSSFDGLVLDCTSNGDYFYQTWSYAMALYTGELDSQKGGLTSKPRQVSLSSIMGGATWSPDGKLLAYYAWRGKVGAQKLVVVIRSMKTGEERELSLKGDFWPYYHKPQWFPDGKSLFMHCWDGKLRQIDMQSGDAQVVDSVKILPPRFAANPQYRSSVVLSPDGRTIYYVSRDEPAHETLILRRDLGSRVETELCRVKSGYLGDLCISPDGSKLAFNRGFSLQEPSRSWAIMTLATSEGEPKEVYKTSQPIRSTMWSNDGSRIFFVMVQSREKPRVISSISSEGGEPQVMDIGLHDLYFLSLNPDGTQIAFSDEQFDNQLWVLKNLVGEEDKK